MKTISAILYILLVLFLPACKAPKETTNSFESSLHEDFTDVFPVDEPGAAILILKADSVVFAQGYGIADLEKKTPITPQTLFNLGSISKTFVANAILKLQEEGKLSVEDSLEKYFDGFVNPKLAQRVRIKHLLTHTSGLPDNRNVGADSVFYLTAKDEENWAPIMRATALNFNPGERFEYSNPAFNALALIIGKVSGVRWQTYVQDNIMRPAGMMNSTITDGPHPSEGVAHGYLLNEGRWMEDDYGEEPTFAASGNGGVWSSVEELASYEKAIRSGVLLNPEVVNDSRTIKEFREWKSDTKPFVGWSWFIDEHRGMKTVGHDGDQGGFLCVYKAIPEKEIFYVILCNTRRDIDSIEAKILQKLEDNNWLEQRQL
jgi:CubicO group peptidase (beta-lactamase class C family)